MSTLEHMEKDFNNFRLCLTGKVITMYDYDGKAIVRYIQKTEAEARKLFFRQVELLEKKTA